MTQPGGSDTHLNREAEVNVMAKSTRSRFTRKADFPLWKHPSGRWCKKVRGKFCYFGKVADDPSGEAALRQWLDDRDDLLPEGRRDQSSQQQPSRWQMSATPIWNELSNGGMLGNSAAGRSTIITTPASSWLRSLGGQSIQRNCGRQTLPSSGHPSRAMRQAA